MQHMTNVDAFHHMMFALNGKSAIGIVAQDALLAAAKQVLMMLFAA